MCLLNCFAWERRLGEICRSFAADLWQKVTFPKGIRGSRGYESRRDFAAQRNGESFADSHSRSWRGAPGEPPAQVDDFRIKPSAAFAGIFSPRLNRSGATASY